jgi:hypothetical protein
METVDIASRDDNSDETAGIDCIVITHLIEEDGDPVQFAQSVQCDIPIDQ